MSLSEAVSLAASQLLDIDFNDIKSGYRIRNSSSRVYIDIYLFDSLSSGAGYCSLLTNKISKLFELTRELLQCKNHCRTACHDCLEHFWNQRVQSRLDRHLALQLLDWMMYGKLADNLEYNHQVNLTIGLKELFNSNEAIKLVYEKEKIYIRKDNNKVELIIYPSMWSNNILRKDKINLSDKLIVKDLPLAYKTVVDYIM